MRRSLAAIVAVLAAAVLAGCGTPPSALVANVPTSGPIEQGEQITTPSDEQFIRVIARGPQPGMTVPQIVRGFLDASASFDGDHAVARQYLTRQASERWSPATGVRVYEGIGEITEQVDEATFTAAEAGRISALGRFDVAERRATMSVSFGLVREDGEWRIDMPPQGLLLSRSDVDRAFRSQSVYFFNPQFTTLVPDPRMVPVLDVAQATSLVRLLLAGPSEWLAPAVRTGFPANVRLNVDSVPVEAGIATVDLTATASGASDSVRQAMSQQLVWTLRQVPGIDAVRITADGVPWSVPNVGTPQPITAWPAVSPNRIIPGASAYALRNGSIWSLGVTGTDVELLKGVDPEDAPLIDLAVSPRAETAAGVDAAGRLWRGSLDGTGGMTLVENEARAVDVSYGPSGWLWIVEQGNRMVRIDPDGAREEVGLPWVAATDRLVRAVPARDGVRIALVVSRPTGTALLLGRVVQRAGVSGVVVDAPRRVESVLADVGDVAWADAEQLAIVGRLEAEGLAPFAVDLGQGRVTALGGPREPIAIAAAPGLPVWVQVADTLAARSSGVWLSGVTGSAPTYPG